MTSFILGLMLLVLNKTMPVQDARCRVQAIIPQGIQVQFDVVPSTGESGHFSYLIKQNVCDDAIRARLVLIPLRNDGKMNSNDGVLRLIVTPHSPGTVSFNEADVERILMVVEWLETTSGKWVRNNADQKVPIEALVEHGAEALPKARFIAKQ